MSETAEEKPALQLNRVIAAPRERVFTAWTTPDAIKVWFRPELAAGTSLVTVQFIPVGKDLTHEPSRHRGAGSSRPRLERHLR